MWSQVRRTYPYAGVTIASRTTTAGGTAVSWLLGDRQGSVTTTITTGTATTRWYRPYGAARGPSPVSPVVTTGFLGKHEDPSGLTHLDHRDYDPTTGTFITIDPLVASTGEPYQYATGNPTTLSDPNGLEPGCGATVVGPYSCSTAHREADRERRRNSSDPSNWGLDWAGEALFHHYVFGGGDELWMVDYDDGDWAHYMNETVFGYIRDGVAPSREDYRNGAYSWEEILAWNDALVTWAVTDGEFGIAGSFPVATINGEGMVGAQFLHGTNADVGGFKIFSPSVDGLRIDADGNTVAHVTMIYQWNDVIDPNPYYDSDKAKSSFAERVGSLIPIVDPAGYTVRIQWSATATYVITPQGAVLSRQGSFVGAG